MAAPENVDGLGVLEEAQLAISANVGVLRTMNGADSPMRSRELSLAITEIETGLLWLERGIGNEREHRLAAQETWGTPG